ncbi:MAG: tetratricopeptide repeat protein [Chloroflexota bacterium]
MYIRTPKRYRGMQRRNVFSCRRFFIIFLLIGLIVGAVGIYQLSDTLQPTVIAMVEGGMEEANAWQATQFAPTPAPTRDPSSTLIDANNEWQAGRIDFALNSYDQVINLLPNDVNTYIRLAEGYLTRGNVADALEYADASVTADPFSADAWATRALVYSWDGNFTEGIASAQQALALDPQNARATAYLGYAYFSATPVRGDLARARAEDAIALNPDLWAGYWVRGLVSENIIPTDPNGAVTDFERAYNLALSTNGAMAGVAGSAWARTVSALGNPDRAVTLFNEMLNRDATNREVLYYLGLIQYSPVGDWGQSQETLRDCVTVAPEDVECWYLLGRSLDNLGNQEEALEAFTTTIDLDTQYARHYWWAARLERNLGSCARATPLLQTGYDMVQEGGLPAIEEGNALLIEAFEDELNTCRIVIPNAQQPAPEATEEATPIVGDA